MSVSQQMIMVLLLLGMLNNPAYAQESDRQFKVSSSAAPNRLALVIGNGAYRIAPLTTPVNDARDMKNILQQVGFKVIYRENAGLREMREAVNEFSEQLLKDGVGLFYFSGYGIQLEGENYLIPVDARIESAADVEFDAMNAVWAIKKMADARSEANIILLDACRTNPFGRSFKTINQAGLAEMKWAPDGSFIAYAAEPGTSVIETDSRNSLFTQYLLKYIPESGLKIEDILKRVRADVMKETGDKQIPYQFSSLTQDFYFAGTETKVRTPTSTLPIHPTSTIPPIPPSKIPQTPPSGFTNSLGMKFVLIAPGGFMMGSPNTEVKRDADEPLHEVKLTKGFFIQTTEVTQAQWKSLMGNNPSDFTECGDGCPINRISWVQVQEFIQKLNRTEGKHYRLPTEAEWEYACRAGSDTSFSAGAMTKTGCYLDPILDSVGWYCHNSASKIHPTAQKQPNAFGLYDMHGNVWEWCQDWYGAYPSGSVTDPQGHPTGSERVLRGGSWGDRIENCRSAVRYKMAPESWDNNIGFRLILPALGREIH